MKFIIIIYTTNKLTIVELEDIRGVRLRKFKLRKIILGVRMHFRHMNSPSGSTLQCDTLLWDDMPLNSPKLPPYWNSTSGFHFHTSPQSTCHSVPVCEILSKSDHPRWRISAIFDCRDPIMGSLKSPVQLTQLPIGRQ